MEDMESLKYPIGKFSKPEIITPGHLDNWIRDLENLPEQLSKLISPLTNDQLQTAYRPEGWNIRQVVHHLADSHTNAFFRFKLALTEDHPVIKPYDQEKWAQCFDSTMVSVKPSLKIIEGIHQRWTMLLRTLTDKDWPRTFYHPERQKDFTLSETAGLYAWHGRHHYQQIHDLVVRMRWF
jgi:hypothetical protein